MKIGPDGQFYYSSSQAKHTPEGERLVLGLYISIHFHFIEKKL